MAKKAENVKNVVKKPMKKKKKKVLSRAELASGASLMGTTAG